MRALMQNPVRFRTSMRLAHVRPLHTPQHCTIRALTRCPPDISTTRIDVIPRLPSFVSGAMEYKPDERMNTCVVLVMTPTSCGNDILDLRYPHNPLHH